MQYMPRNLPIDIQGFIECRFTAHAITLPSSVGGDWPQQSKSFDLDIGRFERTYGILWGMTKRDEVEASDSVLVSKAWLAMKL
jgi:hypothetical protein